MFEKVQQCYLVILMSAVTVFIRYIDRINISVAIISMSEEFGWGPQIQ
ncbi:MAG: hypothetical protein P8Q37_05905 [Porticoccaceae bacterium]|nr:hypothetical protein [Porticoccaceae bacterium]MDG1474418.1 hypothetical protein [Porticoccaceae bacterium]